MNELRFFNRQKTRAISMPLLKRITLRFLEQVVPADGFELGIHLVAAPEMARLNEQFLQHEGSTDVITFNYREGKKSGPVLGEIFICVDDAIEQAKEFNTTWQSEVVRYVVHGILHLLGYDDLKPDLRRTMKREENRYVNSLSREFDLGTLQPDGKKRK
ncbi:MAG: rRNA maturation RNase YbeY [Limisphaerales bacterium]